MTTSTSAGTVPAHRADPLDASPVPTATPPVATSWEWAVIGPLPPRRRDLVDQLREVLPPNGMVASGGDRHELVRIAAQARVTIELPGDAVADLDLRRDVAIAGGLMLEHAPEGGGSLASYRAIGEIAARFEQLKRDGPERDRALEEAHGSERETGADAPRHARRMTLDGIDLWLRTEQGGDEHVANEVILADAYGLRSLPLDAHTIVDVGAHVGAFAAAAQRRWPTARVIALEPNPRSHELLRHNVARLSGVEPVNAAVRYDGASVLTASVGSTGSGFVAHSGEVDRLLAPNFLDRLWRCQVVGTCATTTLEALVPEGPIDLLKLDCEGSEHDILAHVSDELLSRVRVIVGEFHDDRGGEPFEALLRRRLPRHEVVVEQGKPIGLFRCQPADHLRHGTGSPSTHGSSTSSAAARAAFTAR